MNEKMQLLEIIGGARARPAPIAATGLVDNVKLISMKFLVLHSFQKGTICYETEGDIIFCSTQSHSKGLSPDATQQETPPIMSQTKCKSQGTHQFFMSMINKGWLSRKIRRLHANNELSQNNLLFSLV